MTNTFRIPETETVTSCSDCHNKKIRCDLGLPCSACVQSNSSCKYPSISKRPVSRKRQTALELELARARAALLHTYQRQSVQPEGGDVQARVVVSPQQQPALIRETSRVSATVDNSSHWRSSQSHPGHNVSSAFNLETPPQNDLVRDERGSSLAHPRLSGDLARLVHRNDSDTGIASGAAFRRLVNDGDGNVENEPNSGGIAPGQFRPLLLPGIYSLAQLDPFIDSYFTTYHILYPIVHEPTFRAQFMEIVPRPSGPCWHILLYTIAAIGSFAAVETPPETDWGLFDAALRRWDMEMLEMKNLATVQALTLFSNFIQKKSRPNFAYSYMGTAKKLAWGIALHKEFSSRRIQEFHLELRRRVWWVLYSLDVGAIIMFRQPLDTTPDCIEVGIPLNINDSSLTSSTPQRPPESSNTTLYTHLKYRALFHLATTNIYRRLLITTPSAAEMLALDQAHLQKWVNELPVYFAERAPQPPRYRLCHAILQWRYRNFQILMYRPFLIRRFMDGRNRAQQGVTETEMDMAENVAVRKCLDTARDSISLITAYWKGEDQSVLTCQYALYFLFHATLIPVISLRNDGTAPDAPSWRGQILGALESMAEMKRLNAAAERCHDIITGLCGGCLARDITERETIENPQTQMNTLYSYMFGPMNDSSLFDMEELLMQEPIFVEFMGQFGVS